MKESMTHIGITLDVDPPFGSCVQELKAPESIMMGSLVCEDKFDRWFMGQYTELQRSFGFPLIQLG